MNNKLRLLLLVLLASFVVFMAACSNDGASGDPEETPSDDPETEETPEEDEETDGLYSIEDFDHIKDDGTTIDGGELVFGLSSDTPFEGTLNWNFYSGNPDAQVLQWFDEPLLTWDENYVYTQDGAATYEIDEEDNRIWTLTIRDNVNWHDGTPVTAEDWAFAHYVIADPDYDGVRFDSSLRNIEGIVDYHNGEADEISGIEIIDEKTLRITYVQATPSLITGGVWTYPLAKHIYGDIPVEEMSSHAATRQNPIGFGPYKVDSIVPGESVSYSKYEDYWRGEPALDKVTLRVINPSVVVEELRNGGVDMVSSFPQAQFADVVDELSNITWLGNIDRAYTYIGFKLGHWDEENRVNVYDPENAKMGNKNLRQAMWHAVDNDTVGERFYHGLRWAGTTLIPPSHPEFHDATNPGRAYDPERANELLDEAGYVDVDGDGFREDPDGNELVINFASMSGDEIAEPLANYYIQAWANVGLNVQLLDGRLHEFNSFYDRVEADDPDIDIYQGAWVVGIDVDPSGLYGAEASYNYTRYVSDENNQLMTDGLSEAAFDVDYRVDVYNQWQEYMVENVPAFPTLYRAALVPVNNRVTGYAVGDGTGYFRYQVGVTEEVAESAE
ncbi:ABC transporter substrate-binding protein [Alkalihalobacillus alcalophilus ATCC 27647 = CGMCC 1.3604]|uniref:ABC transporter substrate-binding protein n=1 Tax=Alkalihalobacillus alcalophilus ATCC 27647 = CGMCC 1.3604 TaxID=1218173 RepID=J8QCR7_ALKAL|nr:oligopeptide ABC transporter substrate-binding protein [Alkalihalobacillus alcalophilus]AFV25676.1 dipeptide/oligopeptide transporter [Alkalihalobacillus alcalophilus ATCC 27647 = CGMCC 1.3604]KGA96529.1 ABC transporter substrate-binding protein [Alkalihalobacillus alcalophilus ATCC 27647 = CGMCC 1.3604]MED1561687.1 oligopeptide ABC transporter substrate-binding protein [Alkalihalobacillus alcalophilus]THG90917.1 ABC transporter substrate-binding protein [Alkalihalobacillus alcalophilus ATCC